VVQRVRKAPGGLVRAILETKVDRVERVSLSGDLICYPPGALAELEDALTGVSAAGIESTLATSYAGDRVSVPGVGMSGWLAAFGLT
jgi:hypothetical protein